MLIKSKQYNDAIELLSGIRCMNINNNGDYTTGGLIIEEFPNEIELLYELLDEYLEYKNHHKYIISDIKNLIESYDYE